MAPGSADVRGSDVHAEQGAGTETTGYNAEVPGFLRPGMGGDSEGLLRPKTEENEMDYTDRLLRKLCGVW